MPINLNALNTAGQQAAVRAVERIHRIAQAEDCEAVLHSFGVAVGYFVEGGTAKMKAKSKPKPLPRWTDCAVFGISGTIVCASMFLAGKVEMARWFGSHLSIVLVVLMIVTAIRQRG